MENSNIEKEIITITDKILSRGFINDEIIEDEFKRIATEIASGNDRADCSFILEGLCGLDVSRIDINSLSEKNFRRLTFDSDTIFSDEQIERFHPEKIIEQRKSSNSNEFKEIHAQGIDGKGTSIALIDTCFDGRIPELGNRVAKQIIFDKNEDGLVIPRMYSKEDGDGHHGKTTACLAAGNECGIAPKATVYLFGKSDKVSWEEAKEATLQYISEEDLKIDIISMSAAKDTTPKAKVLLDTLKQKGCEFIDSGVFWKSFTWGRNGTADKIELDDLMNEICDLKLDKNSKAYEVQQRMANNIILPCTEKTSIQADKEGVYKYNGSICGASFAIPQVAGYFLLVRQINKNISLEEFIDFVKETSKENTDGKKYIDLSETLEQIKERTKENSEYLEELPNNNFLTNDIGKRVVPGASITDKLRAINVENSLKEKEKKKKKEKLDI